MPSLGVAKGVPFDRFTGNAYLSFLKNCGALVSDYGQSSHSPRSGYVCSFDGVDDAIQLPHLTGSETVVSSDGSSVATISSGQVSFTAGTCSNLLISDGTLLKLDEEAGLTAYDSSGNGNHGTLEGGVSRIVDNTKPYDWANQVGFSRFRNLFPYSNDLSIGDLTNPIDGTSSITKNFGIAPNGKQETTLITDGSINYPFGLDLTAGTRNNFWDDLLSAGIYTISIFIKKKNVAMDSLCRITTRVTPTDGGAVQQKDLRFNLQTGEVITNTTAFYTVESYDDDWWRVHGIYDLKKPYTFRFNAVRPSESNLSGATDATKTGSFEIWGVQLELGSEPTPMQVTDEFPKDVIIPRNEAIPSQDVLGNPLQYKGVYPTPYVKRNSYAASFDGVDDYVAIPALSGSETVVSSQGTSVPTISAGRIDFTAGTCYELTLSNGSTYPLSEGVGDVVYDVSGNGNHGTVNNASTAVEGAGFWGGRQDDYHYNLENGFQLYNDGANNLRIPLGIVASPAGFTKVSDNPAVENGHNDAETEYDFANISNEGLVPPEVFQATTVPPSDYRFNDSLVNPMWKRPISTIAEDRHTFFKEELTGQCLEKANKFFSSALLLGIGGGQALDTGDGTGLQV